MIKSENRGAKPEQSRSFRIQIMKIYKEIISNDEYTDLVQTYTRKILVVLDEKTNRETRTYGFEYEFLARNPITTDHVNQLKAFLLTRGFTLNKHGCIAAPSGLYITFEPGGQIEYSSAPMEAGDDIEFQEALALIRYINMAIQEYYAIEYIPVGYMPGRADAPLCLTSERYRSLHARMLKCGTRGREMMKATASIHLHVSFRNIKEILPLFSRLLKISSMKEFRMSPDRRDIWDNTDPGRCKLPTGDVAGLTSSEKLVETFVRIALTAEDIYTNIPFWQKHNNTFEAFLEHLTTIYTDIRINLKGPTLELRTLDSLPFSKFEERWNKFTTLVESQGSKIS